MLLNRSQLNALALHVRFFFLAFALLTSVLLRWMYYLLYAPKVTITKTASMLYISACISGGKDTRIEEMNIPQMVGIIFLSCLTNAP